MKQFEITSDQFAICRGRCIDGDPVRNLRRSITTMKGAHALKQRGIIGCSAMMLPQVLRPGFHDKGLNISTRRIRILKQSPG
jgi:hypothetical protein